MALQRAVGVQVLCHLLSSPVKSRQDHCKIIITINASYAHECPDCELNAFSNKQQRSEYREVLIILAGFVEDSTGCSAVLHSGRS